MKYKVLSPWAEVDYSGMHALNPRVEDLNGKTVGLYAHFKNYTVDVLDEVAEQLTEIYPDVKFSRFQYKKDTIELVNDPETFEEYKNWLGGVDTVLAALGDMGSCTLFLSYNTVVAEKLGKPAVLLVDEIYTSTARQGASSRMVPSLRVVGTKLCAQDGSPEQLGQGGKMNMDVVSKKVADAMPDIIKALTCPLTAEESTVPQRVSKESELSFTGTLDEINSYFYRMGWTNGAPILPPTEEAVEEMMKGTDLPPDYVVAEIPPMLGKATVKKIAINAVMAGCLPTYMPVLIAAVRGMMDPRIHLEGWTCSRSSWEPFIILNGPIRKAIGINTGTNLLSPYTRAASTISRAFSFITMNIAGVRPVLEDKSGLGHEARFGVCFGENEEESPWAPLQTDYGFDAQDSTVTLFWPLERYSFHKGSDPDVIVRRLCSRDDDNFDPGCCFIIGKNTAKLLSEHGWTKSSLLEYIYEYARKPSSELNVDWLKGNNHLPKELPLPINGQYSVRRFWTRDHLLMLVAGEHVGACFVGGGDHGGPSCTKIELPEKWDELVEQYKHEVPQYIRY